MKLQLALDDLTLKDASSILAALIDVIDIIEVGTPLIMREGVRAVTQLKQAYPDLEVLADLKIIDAGEIEAGIGFDAGADIVTVLGLAADATIQGVLKQARQYAKKVMVDLISVGHVQERAREVEAMGAEFICVHTGYDAQSQGKNPLEELELVQPVLKQAKLAVAGGIRSDTLPQIAVHKPEIVIVGSFITNNSDRTKAALELRRILD